MSYPDDLAGPLRVVSLRDEAIDWQAMAAAGVTPRVYGETRDPDSVRELAGLAAKWYVLRPISVPECAFYIDTIVSEAGRFMQAFRLAVTEVVGFHGPGTALRPTLPTPTPEGGTRMTWGDADLQRVADFGGGMRLIYEIGEIAYERALEGNGRSGNVTFTLPRYLDPVLDRIERRLAAASRRTAGTLSSERSASDSTPTPPENSDDPTAASAASGAT